MGVSEKTVLKYYHPDAVEVFNVSSSIKNVCKLKPNEVWKPFNSQGIRIGQPIKPMLASRKTPDEVIQLMKNNMFYIEEKYDGERIQVHKNDKDFQLFSRNSNNVTSIYGEALIPLLKQHIKVTRCILDGELLVWDPETQAFSEIRLMKTLARSTRESIPTHQELAVLGKNFCYVVFDMLYVNDRSIMNLKLCERLALMKKVVKEKPHFLEVIQQKQATSLTELIDMLDTTIINGKEGLVIKHPNSFYVPAERKDNWVKLKPEYIEGLTDNLDLLIIGGFYGSGLSRRGGGISHWMLGCAVPDQSGKIKQWMPFCKVGTGYSDQFLNELLKELEGKWRKFDSTAPPPHLVLGGGQEVPDVWISPEDSKIMEVKAPQITTSEKWISGYTLRFPRFVKLRRDKNFDESMTLEEIRDLAHQGGGRLAKKKYSEKKGSDRAEKKHKGEAKMSWDVLPQFKHLDAKGVEVQTCLFQGLQFCVFHGDEVHSKNDIERCILQNGGKISANPIPETNFIIASKNVVKIQNLITEGTYDIVQPRWLLECLNEKAILPLNPRFMLFTTEATKQNMLKTADKYGDSYQKHTSIEGLKETFKEIERLKVKQVHEKNPEMKFLLVRPPLKAEILQIEEEYWPEPKWWGLSFGQYIIYLDLHVPFGTNKILPTSSLHITRLLLMHYGAEISPVLDARVTHVIVDPDDLARVPEIRKVMKQLLDLSVRKDKRMCAIHLVSKEWVEESIKAKEDLDPLEFYVMKKHLRNWAQSQSQSFSLENVRSLDRTEFPKM